MVNLVKFLRLFQPQILHHELLEARKLYHLPQNQWTIDRSPGSDYKGWKTVRQRKLEQFYVRHVCLITNDKVTDFPAF